MRRLRALRQLSLALRGAPQANFDWMAVLEIANQAMVTPRLHAAALATGTVDRLPLDVRTFTAEVHRRNRERNRRLLEQLEDAVRALNAAAIEPVLLKGGAAWVLQGCPETFDRMTGDLDLLVRPAEAPRAVDALVGVGFRVLASYAGETVHVVAELGRPEVDVGLIDLHQRPPGPPGLAEIADLDRRCRAVEWRGLRLRAPDATAQALLIVLHDQFHDGGFWRGGLALRRLMDLALIAHEIDWPELDGLCRTELARRAAGGELLAARSFAGAATPPPTLWARLHHARHLAQFAWPQSSLALGALALALETPNVLRHRRTDREDRERLFGHAERRTLSLWADRLRDLVLRPPQVGQA